MKRTSILVVLLLVGFFSYGQEVSWFHRKQKGVCAAYEYGKFSGENGKRLKYSPRGRQTVRGRSHSKMQYHARKRSQKNVRLFNPHK
jgi:hypothetical protein